MSDEPLRYPTEEDQSVYFKSNNEFALKWLNENMVTYDEWIAKHKTNT